MKRIKIDNGDGTVSMADPLFPEALFNRTYLDYLLACGSRGVAPSLSLEEYETGSGYDLYIDQYAQVASQVIGPDGVTVVGNFPYEIILAGNVPVDRTFRAAWEPKPGVVGVNMPRARIMQMDRIRGRRAIKFVELDNAHRTADDDNDGQLKAQIAQERKVLRDIPETFDLEVATTPEELANLWPPELSE